MKNPVVLVHGIKDDASKMKHIEHALRRSGWIVFSISLTPSTGQIGIDELAQQLKTFIQNRIGAEQVIDLIGYSMGGLVSRYYLQRLNGLPRVHRFITISTPHKGTWTAYLLWNKGIRQMRFNSDFILELNSDLHRLKSLRFTSIWTPFDLTILPASSSHVDFAKEIKIKSLMHPLIVSNKQCIQAIEQELRS